MMLCSNCGMDIPDITPIAFKHIDLCPYCRTDVSAARTFHNVEELGNYGADLIAQGGCLKALVDMAIIIVGAAIGFIFVVAATFGICYALVRLLLGWE